MQKNQIMKTAIKTTTFLLAAISFLLFSCDKDNDGYNYNPPPEIKATVLSAAGDSSAIISTINQFRSLLGDSLNFTTGKTSGRREINWDGVPSTFTNNNNFPGNFFNATLSTDPQGRKRGLEYVDAGNGFRVDSTLFDETDASYAEQFAVFSKNRLFSPVNNNFTDVVFKVAGTNTDAFVHGFGIIFSDVDEPNSTTLEFFNGDKSVGVYKAKSAAQNLSFLGAYFTTEKITKVRITSGDNVLSAGRKDISDGGAADLVVMDDFFYDEPQTLQQ